MPRATDTKPGTTSNRGPDDLTTQHMPMETRSHPSDGLENSKMVQCKKQIRFHQQEHIADYHKEGAEEFLHSVGDRERL